MNANGPGPSSLDDRRPAYEIARRYWNHQPLDAPELPGVAAFGGGGLSEMLYRHYEEVRHLRRALSFRRDQAVLEMGCGNGRWALSLAPLVRHYTGVDFSRQMLDIACDRAARLGLKNVTFCESAAQDYASPESFDIIYLSGVSQYLHDEDIHRLLHRLRAAVKPGGVLVDRSTVHRRARLVTQNEVYFSLYRTAEELKGTFGAAGWSNYYHRPSYRFLSFPDLFQRRLNRRDCARLVYATAPASFHFLRLLAAVSSSVFKPTGEVLDFSHDFFLFRPVDVSHA